MLAVLRLLLVFGFACSIAAEASEEVEIESTPHESRWVDTAWRIEDIDGHGLLDGVAATLYFPEPNGITGFAACNRYRGSISIEGDRILSLGPLATTRKMCVPEVMDQERRVLAALARARRLTQEGAFLVLYGEDEAKPLLRASPIDPSEI